MTTIGITFVISLALSFYLIFKSDASEMQGKITKAMLLFEFFLLLIIIALIACIETKGTSEILNIDYVIVDNIGSGLISGIAIAIVIASMMLIRPRKNLSRT